jgi:squalene-hopene/tetraprenyl-beta-curcumene cyclase
MSRTRSLLAVVLAAVAVSAVTLPAAGQKDQTKTWDDTVDKAIAYLRKKQAKDGSWDSKVSPGITGVVVTGLLRTGKVTAKDPMVDKGLKYIVSLIDPKERHIAGKGARKGLQNYVTSINLLALVEAKRDDYKTVIKDATAFLKKLQWDEGDDKDKDSDFFGGAGYDSKSRPDLSNTQIFLDALAAAGVPKTDPAFKKALTFVSRCQNYKSENNDQKWAGKINDGSFVYTAAQGGDTKVTDKPDPDKGLPGYGSMTYAGIKSLIYCGVSEKDERFKKAMTWVQANYTVERNPGMPKARDQWGLYYYYHTMAKCLSVVGKDTIKVKEGDKEVERDWRADITAALAKRQQEDGSWVNKSDRWMEGNPLLVTGYALMTLGYTKPKK